MITLKDNQLDLLTYLAKRKEAIILTGCGMGKTLATLMRIRQLLDQHKIKGALIVAPYHVARTVWPNEIKRWGFKLSSTVITKDKKWVMGLHDIYMVNYESAHKAIVSNPPFDLVVFDELDNAKSPSSERIKRLRPFTNLMKYRWGLTGTPLPNGDLLELFSQVRLIDGGKLWGEQYALFRDRNFFPAGKAQVNGSMVYFDWQPKLGTKERMLRDLSTISITQRAKDFDDIDLPDYVEHDVPVSMPPVAWKVYRQLEKELYWHRGEQHVDIETAATLVTKMLQLTSGFVYDNEGDPLRIHNAKVDRAAKLIKANKGNTLLVASYRFEMDMLERIPGVVRFNKKKAVEQIRQWNRGKIKALLAHPGSISHGLNLQDGGSTIILTTPIYSHGKYEQLVSRLVRIGQEQTVEVHRLLVNDSIDEEALESLRRKESFERSVLRILSN